MGITNFLRMEFNRVIQEELIDTKFADFGEGLVTAFLQSIKLVKTYTFPMEIMEGSFLQCWKPRPYSSISYSNSRKS